MALKIECDGCGKLEKVAKDDLSGTITTWQLVGGGNQVNFDLCATCGRDLRDRMPDRWPMPTRSAESK